MKNELKQKSAIDRSTNGEGTDTRLYPCEVVNPDLYQSHDTVPKQGQVQMHIAQRRFVKIFKMLKGFVLKIGWSDKNIAWIPKSTTCNTLLLEIASRLIVIMAVSVSVRLISS